MLTKEEQDQSLIKRSTSLWRRISTRKRPEGRSPFAGITGSTEDWTVAPATRLSFEATAEAPTNAIPKRNLTKRTMGSIRQLGKKNTALTHMQRIDVPYSEPGTPYIQVDIPKGSEFDVPQIQHVPYVRADISHNQPEKHYANTHLTPTPPPSPPSHTSSIRISPPILNRSTLTPPTTHSSSSLSSRSNLTPPTTCPSSSLPNRATLTPPTTPSKPQTRVLPTSFPHLRDFPPSSTHTRMMKWNIFLAPTQVYSLVLGHAPHHHDLSLTPHSSSQKTNPASSLDFNSNAWCIYSEGPDNSGKLKVHFHRSLTGTKMATLFVLVDLEGEGAGKAVGIKWDGGPVTNRMNEEEAKYLVGMVCAWVLGVRFEGEEGLSAGSFF